MSALTKQELTGLDPIIEARRPLSHQMSDVNNLQSSFVTPSGNSSILQFEHLGLTGGEGLSVDELAQLRGRSFE